MKTYLLTALIVLSSLGSCVPEAAHAALLNKSANASLTNGLVGYWTFDGKDVVRGVVKDLSGNNNDGNLINIATSTFYTQGKIGQAGLFDGTDDRVDMGTPSSLNITG